MLFWIFKTVFCHLRVKINSIFFRVVVNNTTWTKRKDPSSSCWDCWWPCNASACNIRTEDPSRCAKRLLGTTANAPCSSPEPRECDEFRSFTIVCLLTMFQPRRSNVGWTRFAKTLYRLGRFLFSWTIFGTEGHRKGSVRTENFLFREPLYLKTDDGSRATFRALFRADREPLDEPFRSTPSDFFSYSFPLSSYHFHFTSINCCLRTKRLEPRWQKVSFFLPILPPTFPFTTCFFLYLILLNFD